METQLMFHAKIPAPRKKTLTLDRGVFDREKRPAKKIPAKKPATREKNPRPATKTRDPRKKPATREKNPRPATRDNWIISTE